MGKNERLNPRNITAVVLAIVLGVRSDDEPEVSSEVHDTDSHEVSYSERDFRAQKQFTKTVDGQRARRAMKRTHPSGKKQ